MLDMDETGVQLEHNPGKILARKGAKHLQSPTSGNGETITIIACISAAGEACPPHIIPKGKTVKTFFYGHDSHSFVGLIESALQNDIILVELPAHTSHWLQPCDPTVFGPLKIILTMNVKSRWPTILV